MGRASLSSANFRSFRTQILCLCRRKIEDQSLNEELNTYKHTY